jgi:hypothetical protein
MGIFSNLFGKKEEISSTVPENEWVVKVHNTASIMEGVVSRTPLLKSKLLEFRQGYRLWAPENFEEFCTTLKVHIDNVSRDREIVEKNMTVITDDKLKIHSERLSNNLLSLKKELEYIKDEASRGYSMDMPGVKEIARWRVLYPHIEKAHSTIEEVENYWEKVRGYFA